MDNGIQRVKIDDLGCKDLRAILDAYGAKHSGNDRKGALQRLVEWQMKNNPNKILAHDEATDKWRVIDRPVAKADPNAPVDDDSEAVDEIMPDTTPDQYTFHKFRMKSRGFGNGREIFDVTLDGKPLMCRDVEVNAAFDDLTTVKVELICDEVDIESELRSDNLIQPATSYDAQMLQAYKLLQAAALKSDRPLERQKATKHIVIREMRAYLQNKGLVEKEGNVTQAQMRSKIAGGVQ